MSGTATTAGATKRYREFLQDEVNGAALYRALAAAEQVPERAAVLRQLADTEERHAQHWLEALRAAGEPVNALPAPGWRPRVLAFLARRLGTRAVLPVAQAMEAGGGNVYAGVAGAEALAADEREHGRAVTALAGAAGLPTTPAEIAGRERWHRARDGGGSLRAAVFGVQDGLVSNLSLIMGVAGADPGQRMVILSGVAALLAGAFSMAAGEWVSMTAQRELFERQIALEKEELARNPEEEAAELALIYQAKGLPADEARMLAGRLLSKPAVALDTLAREELGLNPDELGSPWKAAISSLIMFALGALVPLVAFLFTSGSTAIVISALLSGLGLLTIGAAMTLFTGRSVVVSALRMLAIGAGAALITWLVGRLIGVSVA